MIVSASRRTDIPAFYAEWLLARLHEGYALSVNPMNPSQVRRVSLLPGTVDGLVFWSKNPRPLLAATNNLETLRGYAYYLQYTLNAYGSEVEPRVPPLEERTDTLLRWAEAAGPERVLWRYDPILLSDATPADWHLERFARLAARLSGATRQVTISFLDDYAKIRRSIAALGAHCPTEPEMRALAPELASLARANGLRIAACAEPLDFAPYGIEQARCVDAALLSALSGRPPITERDANQRAACGCAASVDIGAYNCCSHRCAYCYANAGEASVARNLLRHDPSADSLLGTVADERKKESPFSQETFREL